MKSVAICGAGYIVPHHIAGWRAAGVDIQAIADPDENRAQSRAREFGISSVFADVETMLNETQSDILDVASPRQFHVQQVRMGLARNMAVMCQKPVAPGLDEAEALAGELKASDRLMIHENWRFRPEYRKARKWLAEGRLGTLHHATMAMRSTAMKLREDGTRAAGIRQPFMLEEPRLVLAEVLIHNIDVTRFLLGNLTLKNTRIYHGDPDLAGETSASLYFENDAGLPVFVSGDMIAFGTPDGATDRLEIIGTRGRITLENGLLSLHSDQTLTEDFSQGDQLRAAAVSTIKHFVQCLETGAEFETNIHDNLQTLSLVEQAYKQSQ